MSLSIIIPCYQNEFELETTVFRIVASMKKVKMDYEIILIDDASTDGTWKTINSICSEYHFAGGIGLVLNTGAYSALVAGLEYATGANLLVMAADGDDSPELIPQLLELLVDADTVLANREQTAKAWYNRFFSEAFYTVLRLIGVRNIPKGGADFLVFKRAVYSDCMSIGFKKGNTLIQLVQHAHTVKTIPYTKGNSKASSWSIGKRITLFFQTVCQFLPTSSITNQRVSYRIEGFCGLLRSFNK